MRRCEIAGCDRKHYGRGLCKYHYWRWWSSHPKEARRAAPQARWPLGPLLAASGLSIEELARRVGSNGSSIHRYVRRGGLPTYTADRLAIAAHLHPAEVWGWAWYEDSAEAEAS